MAAAMATNRFALALITALCVVACRLNEFWTPEKIASFYRTWQGPEVFEFADLAYETLGPDAVVVVGLFRWKEPGKPEGALVSYTALLTRHDGRLRIRLEHESAKASAP